MLAHSPDAADEGVEQERSMLDGGDRNGGLAVFKEYRSGSGN